MKPLIKPKHYKWFSLLFFGAGLLAMAKLSFQSHPILFSLGLFSFLIGIFIQWIWKDRNDTYSG